MERTEEIWREFHGKLLNFVNKRVDNCTDAEDILQDVFVKIHNNIDNMNNYKKTESWIYQITRNTLTDYYRTRKHHEELPEWLESSRPAESVKEELSACISSLVNHLPDKYRKAIEVSDIQGNPQKDLAGKEKISLSGAKSRIQRGRSLIRKMLYDCCRIESANHDQFQDCISKDGECSEC